MASKVGVIIPAAGAGKRLGGISKPLIEIGGTPIILRLIALFGELESVAGICIAVPKAEVAGFRKIVDSTDLRVHARVVEGGEERPFSVKNAFEALSPALSDNDLVCVHDAARPLLSKEDLDNVIAAARENDAAFLASRVKDTLKSVDKDGHCIATIDRSALFAAQTPQVMTVRLLKKAYAEVSDYSGVTDEMMLMEMIGVKAIVVESKHLNFKVTTSDDLDLLRKIVA